MCYVSWLLQMPVTQSNKKKTWNPTASIDCLGESLIWSSLCEWKHRGSRLSRDTGLFQQRSEQMWTSCLNRVSYTLYIKNVREESQELSWVNDFKKSTSFITTCKKILQTLCFCILKKWFVVSIIVHRFSTLSILQPFLMTVVLFSV